MQVYSSRILVQLLGSMEFSVHATAYACVDNSWKCREIGYPFNRLYLVKSGSALLYCGGKEYRIDPGMAYLLPAGLTCTYRCPDRMEMLYFHFNYTLPDRYDIFWGSSQIGCLPVPDGLWEQLDACVRREQFLDAMTIQQGILTIAVTFIRETGMGRAAAADYSEIVLDTIDYIRRHLSARLRIEQLAQRHFVSRTHLTETFRKETGITLGRYIDEQLMLEAQRRLIHTKDTIGTISRDLCFCDQFYFSNRFTQLCGLPPQVYRKNTK